MTRDLMLHDADETRRLGRALADAARPGLVIALQGQVGAGKTTLCQGFIERRTGIPYATSPTFTLLQAYPDALYHLDLYRLASTDLSEFGIEEILAPDALLLVEWPERAGHHIPTDRLTVRIEVPEEGRLLHLEAQGEIARQTLLSLRWPT